MDLSLLQTLTLAAVVSFLLLRVLAATRRRRRLPPGPTPLPIIGNILHLGSLPHRDLARLATVHGPLFSLHLGAVTTVVACSPEAARELLHKHDAAFSYRDPPHHIRARGYASNSLLWSAPDQRWRALRRICTAELFSAQRLDAHRSLRRHKVDEMIAYVQKLSERKEPVEIGRVAFTTSLNLVSNSIFSTDMAQLESSSSQEFMDIIVGLFDVVGATNISDFFPVLAPADLQGCRRRFSDLMGRLFAVFDEQIARRKQARAAGLPANGDMLDVLLDVAEKEDGRWVTPDTLRSFFADLFAGGSDTSANTVEWAMTELLRSPQSMARAQQELAEVVGHGREMEESDIAQLPYLKAVVKETLRLYPPGLLIFRSAHQSEQVGRYTVPEGARIIVNVWAVGRSEAAWKDAEQFTPERFLDSGVDFRGHDFQLLPFGAGRRICPGIPLADRMVHLMLGTLLQRFNWRVTGELAASAGDLTEKFGLALRKAVALRALATPVL